MIVVPFNTPDGDNTIMIGDWYNQNHTINIKDKLSKLKEDKKTIKQEIKSIQPELQKLKSHTTKRMAEIKKLEKRINEIVDRIYEGFSVSVGVGNIREYEEGQLKGAQQMDERRISLSNQMSKLKSQLEYEQERDMESQITEMESSLTSLDKELKQVQKKDSEAKLVMDGVVEEINQLNEEVQEWKSKADECDKAIQELKKRRSDIATRIGKSNREIKLKCSDKIGLSLELGSFVAGVMISTTDFSQHTLEQALTSMLKERLLSEGRRPYVIPVGGSNSLGTW